MTKHTVVRMGLDTKFKKWKIVYWNVLNIINKDIKKTYSLKGFRQVKRNNFIEINSFKDLKKK